MSSHRTPAPRRRIVAAVGGLAIFALGLTNPVTPASAAADQRITIDEVVSADPIVTNLAVDPIPTGIAWVGSDENGEGKTTLGRDVVVGPDGTASIDYTQPSGVCTGDDDGGVVDTFRYFDAAGEAAHQLGVDLPGNDDSVLLTITCGPILWTITEEPGGIRWTSDGGQVEAFPGDRNQQIVQRFPSQAFTGTLIESRLGITVVAGGESCTCFLWQVGDQSEMPVTTSFQRYVDDDEDLPAPSRFTLLEGDFNGPFGFKLINSGSANGQGRIYYLPRGEGSRSRFTIPAFDVLLAGGFAEAQFISGVTTPIPFAHRVGGALPRAAAVELSVAGTASLTVELDTAGDVDVPIAGVQTNDSVFQGDPHFADVVLSGPDDRATESLLIRDTYAITPTIADGHELTDATCTGGADAGTIDDGTLTVAIEPREDVTCTLTVIGEVTVTSGLADDTATTVAGVDTAFTPVVTDDAGEPYDTDPATWSITDDDGAVDTAIDPDTGEITVSSTEAGDHEIILTVPTNLGDRTVTIDLVVTRGETRSLVLAPSATTVDQGGSITIETTGSDEFDNESDATDDVVLTSDVATDEIEGNTVTFPHASPHVITATHPDGATASVTIDVTPAAGPTSTKPSPLADDDRDSGVTDRHVGRQRSPVDGRQHDRPAVSRRGPRGRGGHRRWPGPPATLLTDRLARCAQSPAAMPASIISSAA